MGYEYRRGQLLGILPRELRRDVFRRLGEFKSIAGIKEWIREQLELERDWNATDARTARPKPIGMVDLHDDDEPSENDMDALLALNEDSTPDEILAVQQRFRRFGPRSGGAPKGKGKGKGKGG